jgi:hypothetical protein
LKDKRHWEILEWIIPLTPNSYTHPIKYLFRDTSIEIEEFQFYQTPLKYGGDCEKTIVIDAAVVMLGSEWFWGLTHG